MNALFPRFALLIPLSAVCALAAQPVSFEASNGSRVYGEFYAAANTSAPVILLFHQAGSNQAEYAPIAPKLVGMGFNCLAIDQRSGGTMWGTHNRTAAQFRKVPDYPEALKDMEAALDWAQKSHPGPVVVWGSSYSASLVFLLAAKHPNDVKAVLAFSPSDTYMDPPGTVLAAAAKLSCPVFVDTAKDPVEIARGKRILDAVASKNKTQFEPGTAGVHGSSTLRADRNPRGADENWKAVSQFLSQLH
jgi:dienelactone hydrolase